MKCSVKRDENSGGHHLVSLWVHGTRTFLLNILYHTWTRFMCDPIYLKCLYAAIAKCFSIYIVSESFVLVLLVRISLLSLVAIFAGYLC